MGVAASPAESSTAELLPPSWTFNGGSSHVISTAPGGWVFLTEAMAAVMLAFALGVVSTFTEDASDPGSSMSTSLDFLLNPKLATNLVCFPFNWRDASI